MDKEKNVLIRFTADSGGLDETNQKITELNNKNKELWSDYDKTVAQKKAAAKGTSQEAYAMQKYNDKLKNVTSEISRNEKSIERLEKSMKKIPKAIPEKAVQKSFRTIKRELEDQIKYLELMGKSGTAEYQKLIKEAGRLADVEGDVARQIKGIASDTAGFDLIMEGTQGIAAVFQIAQGAAALFGVEEEKLMDMMVKLQAIMAVTSGLQQAQNIVQKESYVMRAVNNLQLKYAAKAEVAHARAIAIKTGSEKGSIAALGKATIAQRAFNLVAKANPYVLLATALISAVGAVVLLTKANKDHNFEQKRMNELQQQAIEGYNEQQVELEIMKRRVQDNTVSLEEKKKMLKKVNETYLDSKHQLKDVNELEAWLVKATPAVVQAYISRATAEAARQKAVETNMKLLEDQKKSDEDYLKWHEKADVWFMGLFGKGEERKAEYATEYRVKSMFELQKEKAFYIEQAIEQGKIADKLYTDLGLKFDDYNDEKDNKSKEYRELVKKNEEELQNTLLSLMEEGKAKEIKSIEINYGRKIEAINKSADKEGKLRKVLIEAREKDIAGVEKKYADEAVIRAKELDLLRAENASKGSPKLIALKKIALKKQAELDIAGIEQSERNEETRSEKIKAIRLKLKEEIGSIDRDVLMKSIDYSRDIRNEEMRAEKIKNEQILLDANATMSQKKVARERLKNFEIDMIRSEMLALDDRYAKGLIDEEAYNISRERLLNDSAEREVDIAREVAEQKKQLQQAVFDTTGQLGNALFGIQRDNLQREMDDLEHFYTTDAEEAKNNNQKKLISEKELARKKLEIKRKQAEAEKNESMFNIAISTAQSIMSSAKMGFPQAIPFIAMAAALGAVQLAAVASRPLPKYFKGRKNGKEELSWVGEHGPELMFVPNNARIVPAHESRDIAVNKRFDLLSKWDIPGVYNIELPRVSKETIREVNDSHRRESIDYDLLGRSVAKYIKIPQKVEKNVHISVDKDGITLHDDMGVRKSKNKKYTGVWN